MSGIKKLVSARRQLTGETFCQAKQGLKATVGGPLVPAASRLQAELESEILDELGYGIAPQSSDGQSDHPFGIATVLPRRPDRLEIVVPDFLLSEIVLRVLPRIETHGGFVKGVVGLRARTTRRGLRLRRVHAAGEVLLRGATSRMSVADSIEAEWDAETSTGFEVLSELPTLHEYERERLDVDGIVDGQRAPHGWAVKSSGQSILSSLLRCLHVFDSNSRMNFTDLWFNEMPGRTIINVEWAGDLAHDDVASRLFGSGVFDLAVDEDLVCICSRCMGDRYRLCLRDRSTGCVELNLRKNAVFEEGMSLTKPTTCGSSAASRARLC